MHKKKRNSFGIFLSLIVVLSLFVFLIFFMTFSLNGNTISSNPSLEIINNQSYPIVEGEWTVNFKTKGKGDLIITSRNGTLFGNDLEFVGLFCGDEKINFTFINSQKIYVKDYYCDNVSKEISKVLTTGKHHLQFQFGNKKYYANNDAVNAIGYRVQQGIYYMSGTDEYIPLNFSVNTSHAFVIAPNLMNQEDTAAATSGDSAANDDNSFITLYLYNSTHIRAQRESSSDGTFVVTWQVLEAMDNEFSVQRGEHVYSGSAATTTDTIPNPVQANESMSWFYIRTTYTGRNGDKIQFFSNITDNTTIQFEREDSGTSTDVSFRWAVVEWNLSKINNFAKGYTGEITGDSSSPDCFDTGTTIQKSSSILFHQSHAISDSDGGLDSSTRAGYIQDDNNVCFYDYDGSFTAGVKWFLVDFPNATQREENQNTAWGSTDYSDDITFSNTYSPNQTLFWLSGTCNGDGIAKPRHTQWWYTTGNLNSVTGFHVERTYGGQNREYSWQVLELPYFENPDSPTFSNFQITPSFLGSAGTARFNLSATDNSDSITSLTGTLDGTPTTFNQGTGNEWYYDFSCSASETINFTFVEAEDNGYPSNTNSTAISGVALVCDLDNPLVDFDPTNPDNNFYTNKNYFQSTISLIEPNFKNITFALWNSSGIVNQTTYSSLVTSINFTGLKDSIYYYNATVFDLANNENSTLTRTITIDTTPPQIQFTTGTENNNTAFQQDYIYVNISATEINEANLTFYLYNETDLIYENTFDDQRRELTWTLLPDGTYKYNTTMFDLANNQNSTEERIIILDNAQPTIDYSSDTLENNSNVSQNYIYINTTITETNFKNITFNLYDVSGLLNSTTFTNQINQINFTNLPDGNYKYNVTIFDIVNQSSSTQTRNVLLDTINPQIDFTIGTLPDNSNVSQNYIYINTTITETNFKNITFNLYDGSGLLNSTTYNSQITEINFTGLSTANITYYYNVTIFDVAGNQNSTFTRTIKLIDVTLPYVAIISPVNKTYTTTTPFLSYNAIDENLDSCWYNIDLGSNISIPSCQNTSVSVSDESYHTLYLFVNDSVGNVNNSQVTFFVNTSLIFTDNYYVQRGSSYVDGQTNENINEIDSSKSFIFMTARSTDSGPDSLQVIPYFSDNEVLTLENYASGGGADVEWETITGPDISVQRSEVTYTTTDSSLGATIKPVNLSSSFIIVNNRLNDGTGGNNVEGHWTGRFVNDSYISFERGATGTAGELSWQVVQWEGSEVQSGNLTSDLVSDSVSLSSTIPLENSFLIFSKRTEGGNTLADTNLGGILGTDNIVFYRQRNTGTIYAEWFVVTDENFKVRRGNFSIAASSSPTNTAFATLKNESKSFNWHSRDSTGTGTTYANSVVTTAITSDSNLQTIVGTTAGNTRIVNWQVIEIEERNPPQINLVYPENNSNLSSHTIDLFNYSVSDDTSIENCTLYGNWSGAWQQNETSYSIINDSINSFGPREVPQDGHYIWNVECFDLYGNSGISNSNFTFASFLFPDKINPDSISIVQSSNDGTGTVTLAWNSSNHSTSYNIYYSDENPPNFTLLSSTNKLNYTDNTSNNTRRRFYKISAQNPSGENFTNVTFGKTVYTLERKDSSNTRNWVGLYLENNLSDANSSLNEIPEVTSFTTWNSTIQKRVTCNDFSCPTFPSCTETNCNFDLIDGQGYEVNINSSGPLQVNWSSVGKTKSASTIGLLKNSTSFGKNWISIIYNTTLYDAEDLISNISYSDSVTKWDATNQNSIGLITSPFPWIPYVGINFNIEPEIAYEVSVTQNLNWTQL